MITTLLTSSVSNEQRFRNMMATSTALGDYELISTNVLATDTASVVFSSLNTSAAVYKHLQIRLVARTANAAATDTIALRFNGDTAANYAEHVLYGNGTSGLSANGTSATFASCATTAGNSATANIYGPGIVDILNFNGTVSNKVLRSFSGNSSFVQFRSGLWMSTSAITSITLYSATASNLLAGSRFSLYGFRG